jgi:DNA gyrase/topoisomerase IV subunit A
MIRKSDVQWWVLETKKHPESAATIVEQLAERLIELDSENERLRDELVRTQRGAGPARPDREVQALQRQVQELQSRLGTSALPQDTEPLLLLLSDELQVAGGRPTPIVLAQVPFSQARHMARQGQSVAEIGTLLNRQALLSLKCMLLAWPHEELLLLTSQGRGLKVLPSDILPSPPSHAPSPRPRGRPPPSPSETLAAAVAVARPPRFWTIATRQGYVQRFVRVALEQSVAQGTPLLSEAANQFASSLHNDEPVSIVKGDRGDLLLITRWGKGVRFPQQAIETQGSIALQLDPDDEIVAALAVPSHSQARAAEILILTASGYAMRRDIAQFPARTRPGGAGRTLIQAQDVLTAFVYPAGDQGRGDRKRVLSRSPEPSEHVPREGAAKDLLCLTFSGQLALFPVPEIPLQERASKGTPLGDMRRDPAIAAMLIRVSG